MRRREFRRRGVRDHIKCRFSHATIAPTDVDRVGSPDDELRTELEASFSHPDPDPVEQSLIVVASLPLSPAGCQLADRGGRLQRGHVDQPVEQTGAT